MTFPSFPISSALRTARIIGLLAAAALMAGCSAVKLGYNTLPTVAYWWLDGYVDFSQAQAPRVRDSLARLQRWHRSDELPRYVALLQQMERLAPGEISAAQICTFAAEIRNRLAVIGGQVEADVAQLVQDLAPDQLRHLEAKYQKNDAEYRTDWIAISAAEQRDKRFKQFLERSEMIYGRLDEPQHAILHAQIDRSVFDARLVLAERERRQQDALRTLRMIASQSVAPDMAAQLVHGYLERVLQSPDPVLRAHQDNLLKETCQSLAAVHNSTSAEQRETAARRLRAYQRDLRDLAAQP